MTAVCLSAPGGVVVIFQEDIMHRFFFCLSLLLLFILSGCSSVTVNYDYDPGADFSTIHTYGWGKSASVDDELTANPLLKKRIDR